MGGKCIGISNVGCKAGDEGAGGAGGLGFVKKNNFFAGEY
jgi:hypothetical protein